VEGIGVGAAIAAGKKGATAFIAADQRIVKGQEGLLASGEVGATGGEMLEYILFKGGEGGHGD
jgi:hypothetical protein